MRLKIKLTRVEGQLLPFNYQYPLSAAIYKIIAKGDVNYAAMLHEKGYGSKGFKLFTFSQLNTIFSRKQDRMVLESNEAVFLVAFHLPQALENFVKGLFQSENIIIADRYSKVTFKVASVESLSNPLHAFKENEIVNIKVRTASPIIAGVKKDNGNYDFLEPDQNQFIENLIYNWRSKIKTCYDIATSSSALLMMEQVPRSNPPKSRLITIKADTDAKTKVRGWMNLELKLTGEKRFVALLLNSGIGIYNAQGMGCVDVIVN